MLGAGMSNPETMGERLERIRLNRDKLDACPRHSFDPNVPGIEGGVGAMFGQRMVCKRCNGSIDLVALSYYIRGYEANGGNGNDIMPGWREEPGNGRKFFKAPEDA